MIKKILLWGSYLLFIGVLIWAGINRTTATLNNGTGAQTYDNGNHQETEAENSALDLQIYPATVTALTRNRVSVTLQNGLVLSLNARPWRYAQTQGFQAAPGDELLITAKTEGNELKILHLRNLSNATTAQLRDENGHPLWNAEN